MADALLSPAVGSTMLAVTAGVTAYSIKKVQTDLNEGKVPLMGVMGAFVFAVQMINFTIPGTGSSGHLAGGMLLAIILGPYAGFLTMASILFIQALFFADGGLLAFGSNALNMGFYTCFIVYPLIYQRLVRSGLSARRIFGASMLSAIIGLQLGSFSVVLQTFFSGKTDLPFNTFLFLMQPIHLAIGVVEGLVTAAIVVFVWKARPEIIHQTPISGSPASRKVLVVVMVFALITAGFLSWFASTNPDGLEWSILKSSGKEELEASGSLHQVLAQIQSRLAFLPDYSFKEAPEGEEGTETDGNKDWPAVNGDTSVAGLVGSLLTFVLVGITGFTLKKLKNKKNSEIKTTCQ